MCVCEATGPVGQVTGHGRWSAWSSLKASAAMTPPYVCAHSGWPEMTISRSKCVENIAAARGLLPGQP